MILDLFKLDGRIAVVTGGRRGLGQAMAAALAQAGADIACVSKPGKPTPRGSSSSARVGAFSISRSISRSPNSGGA